MKVRSALFAISLVFLIPPAWAQTAHSAAPAPHPPVADAAHRQFAAALAAYRKDPDDVELRAGVIDAAKALKTAPLVPLTARTQATKAADLLKTAATAEEFEDAAAAYEKAAALAPWFTDAYLNAAAAHAKAADLEHAESDLALYMSAVREGADTAAAEALQKEIDRQQAQRQFAQELTAFQKNPSESLRQQIVKLAGQLEPPPEIPAEAQQHEAKGKQLVAAATKVEDLKAAIAEFNSALMAAPWWPDPVHDVAQTQAVQRQFDFQALVLGLQGLTRYSPDDEQLRRRIIAAAPTLPTPPQMPQEAIRHMARGQALLKMGGAGSYAEAAREMEQSVLAAPWFADGYYNLGLVQESGMMYQQAMANLQLYLLAAPQAANVQAVQTKIYELEVMAEDQQKTQSLAGTWRTARGHTFHVSVDGNKITIVLDPYTESGVKTSETGEFIKKGLTLEGTLTDSLDPTDSNCALPTQTNPATGIIAEDFHSIKFTYRETTYQWHWETNPSSGENVCTGVNSLGAVPGDFQLVARVGP